MTTDPAPTNPYEPPGERSSLARRPAAGRVRRGLGLILLLIAVAIEAKVIWGRLFEWDTLPEASRHHLVVHVWLGGMSGLIGYWLAYRSRVAIWLILPFTIAWTFGFIGYAAHISGLLRGAS